MRVVKLKMVISKIARSFSRNQAESEKKEKKNNILGDGWIQFGIVDKSGDVENGRVTVVLYKDFLVIDIYQVKKFQELRSEICRAHK